MINQNFLILLTILFISKGYSQNIVNGDFEINNATDCHWNLTDSTYNILMSNSWSFGNNTESGIDIRKSVCGMLSSPSNIWFVSLSNNYTDSLQYDALSLELDTNLITGNTYQISYFEYARFGGHNFNISIEIGLSTDSLSFGELIHSSLPNIHVWTHRTFNFIAPNNGKYVTVHNEPLDTVGAWNSVDAFQIISLTVNNDISKNQIFSIYPNPFEKELNVALINNEVSEIILNDIASRKIMQRQYTNSDSFSTEQLAKGMYLYEIRDRNGLYTKGKVVKD